MICVLPPVADLLAEPDARAERVSQLLAFTPCEPLEERGEFTLVRGPDGYEGWIRSCHLGERDLPEPNLKVARPIVPVRDPGTGEVVFRLCLDTPLSGEAVGAGIRFGLPNGGSGMVPAEATLPLSRRGSVEDLIRLARELIGTPYLWGGTTPFGFDCSGFVQRLYHFVFGHWLPRDSGDQARVGRELGPREARDGDLVFLPGHVGILAGGCLLHASARAGMVVSTPLRELPDEIVSIRRPPPLL